MPTEAPPILAQYDGEGAFSTPSSHWARLADKHFVIGQRYPLIRHEERSHSTHAHYFATVADLWSNLPDTLAERFSSPEMLRKFALIQAGFADTHTLLCSSKAEAQRVANFMRPVDAFSVITVKDATVTRYSAHSQSLRAMDKKEFQRSKDEVLRVISEMIGVTKAEMQKHSASPEKPQPTQRDYLGTG